MRIGGLVVWLLLMVLAPLDLPAVESRPRSIIVLGLSDPRGPFYYQAFSALIVAIILVQGALMSILLHRREAELCRARRGTIVGDASGGKIARYRSRRR